MGEYHIGDGRACGVIGRLSCHHGGIQTSGMDCSTVAERFGAVRNIGVCAVRVCNITGARNSGFS